MTDTATPGMHALAGALGGSGALFLTYPLQTISMLRQMHAKSVKKTTKNAGRGRDAQDGRASPTESLGHDDSSDSAATTPTHAATTRKTVAEVLKTEGIQRLYSGIGSAMYGQVVIQAVYYYLYRYIQEAIMKRNGGEFTSLNATVCASLAGTGGAVLTNPLWVVSTRQIKTGSKNGTLQELLDLAKSEGFSGLFSGLGPALILVSNPTIQFGVFEKVKSVWLRMKGKPQGSPLTPGELFVCGAIGKLAATICTYPYIMAKTTLQSQSKSEDTATHYEDTIACLIGVYKTEGIAGLYNGISSKAGQSVLAAALLFVLQDTCLRLVQALVGRLTSALRLK